MRLRRMSRDQLNLEQIALFDEISGGRRSQGRAKFALLGKDGALEGPFNAMLLAPVLGSALQELGAAIRYRGEISPRVRESAILMVATKGECRFERSAHEPLGLEAGLTQDDLVSLSLGATPKPLTMEEEAAFELSRRLVDYSDLNDEDYLRLVAILGEATIFEISTLIGYYSTLALQIRIFRV